MYGRYDIAASSHGEVGYRGSKAIVVGANAGR